ncbi:MAG: hypothetical protein ACLFT4_10740, partial [Bacteroidales bacterium]
ITSRFFALFLIGSMTLMITNKVIFTHAHEKNGKIIFHAHPYDKAGDTQPGENHHHSEIEFTLIGQLELLFPFFVMSAAIIVNSQSEQRNTEVQSQHSFYVLPSFYGRGPPIA